jgi:hypothetical protein
MTEWDRRDAEMAIALKRVELNHALDYKKSSYDAEEHNICLALVSYKDATSDVLVAYSNDSAIPESTRLGQGLIPDVSIFLPASERYGCGGMAQFHTEPKLLNYLCATSVVRLKGFQGDLPQNAFYRSIVQGQRKQAIRLSDRLKRPEEMRSVTLVTEIDCCPTCTRYSILRFRAKFPDAPLHVIELGKKVRGKVPPQYQTVKVQTRG